jgi:hypothetical protein
VTSAWGSLPARARPALWYTAFLTTTVVVLGSILLLLVQRVLYATADDVLRSKAAVQTEADVSKGRLTFEAVKLPNTDVPTVATGLDIVRLWDSKGRAIYSRDALAGVVSPDTDAILATLADRHTYATMHAADGTTIRLYMEPIRDDKATIVGVIHVGRSLAEIEAALDQICRVDAGGAGCACARRCWRLRARGSVAGIRGSDYPRGRADWRRRPGAAARTTTAGRRARTAGPSI